MTVVHKRVMGDSRTARRAPDFLSIGAQKSGTSSIVQALGASPRVWITPKKELHYFNRHIDDPGNWNRYRDEFSQAPRDCRVGEATPDYLPTLSCARRIHDALPRVRLIMCLRNPVDRAHSAFWHAKRLGRIPRSMSFESAIDRDTREFGSPWTSVLESCCYSTHLLRYLSFFPEEQVHVLLFDDLLLNPAEAISGILRHIDRKNPPEHQLPGGELPHANAAQRWILPVLTNRLLRIPPGRKFVRRAFTRRELPPPMEAATRQQLINLYQPWNQQLEGILGRSLKAWSA